MIGRVFIKFMMVAITAVILASAAYARTIYVRTDGSDSNSGDSWAAAKNTLNAAMDIAVSGDNIWVARGTYQVGSLTMKHLVYLYGGFRGDETGISFADPAANVTILNSNGSGPVVFVPTRAHIWISGFTIHGGTGYLAPDSYERCGGGIYCERLCGITIAKCIIEHNDARDGGGIYFSQSSTSIIKDSIVRENSIYSDYPYQGGGIYCGDYGYVTIANNIIQGNAAKLGGGIYCKGATIDIVNNTIIDNRGGYEGPTYGGGICCETDADVTISNNIVAFNHITPFYDYGGPGGIMALECSPVLRNNCVYGNEKGDYSGVDPGQGDISQDPMLIPVQESGHSSYHLSILSPCINAGWNTTSATNNPDIDDETRVNEGTVDIGADEYWPSKTYYVNNVTGSDSYNGLSWGRAKKTISAALKAATWQDQIWVAKGTYVEHILMKRSVQLYGGFVGNEAAVSQRPKFPRPTPDLNASILDGNLEDTVVTSMSGASQSPIIDGFIIRKGYGSLGGGIACFNDSNLLIRNNTIGQNNAGDGGGVYCEYSSPQLSRNIILNNTAYDRGGGIFVFNNLPGDRYSFPNHPPEISHCVIGLNTAQTGDGGGIFCRGNTTNISSNFIARNTAFGAGGGIRTIQSEFAISNNIIAQNKAGYGGGIHIHDSNSGSVTNNTVTANAATQFGGGVDFVSSMYVTIENNIVTQNTMGIGQYGTGNNVTLRNNDVWGNNYADYYVVSPGTGDISANPQFVDWANGDYHIGELSPCINAGANDAKNMGSYDIEGQPRISNAVVDIGADEWYAVPPPHKITLEGPILRPQIVKPGEFVYCNIGAQDSYGQDLTYEWSDGGAGGYFPEPFTQAPIYVAPSNASGQSRNIVLTCVVTSSVDQSVSASGSVELAVESISIPGDFTGDNQVTISDATLFVNEWVRVHQVPPPAFDPVIDGPFDLYPHTAGVWPNWTPIGDSVINISDATAFIQCWTGSHPSSPASAAQVRPNGH